MGEGVKCIKLLVCVFNVIYFITGIALIVIGVIVQTDINDYENGFTTDNYTSLPAFLIVVGVIVFLIAFVGCCGVVRENFLITLTYAALLVLIFIFEISAGIAGYVLKDDVRQEVSDGMYSQLKLYNSSESVKKAWDLIQHEMECCGVNNATDWEGRGGFHETQYPDSCCQKEVEGCGVKGDPSWERGCLTELEEVIESNVVLLGGVGVGFAFGQIIGVLLACRLARAIKN